MPRLSRLSLLLAALLCAQAHTQAIPQKSETDQLVDQLIENAASNRAALPSLTAHESIASKLDEVVFFGKNGDKAEATVHLIRKSPDSPDFKEIRQITTFNSKPVAPGQQAKLHFDLNNDFDDFQSMYFNAKNRSCFSYTLAPHPKAKELLILSMTHHVDSTTLPGCAGEPRDVILLLRIDPATHQIRHLEDTITSESQKPNSLYGFLSVDYAPAKVGDKTFWLPTTVDGHLIVNKTRWKWHSSYSDYHQYTSSIKLLPDTPATAPDSN